MAFLALAATMAVAAACEPEVGTGLYGPQLRHGHGGDDDDASLDHGDAGGAPTQASMTGVWALATDWSTCVRVFNVMETRSRTLILVNIEQEGFLLRETHEICQIVTTPVMDMETRITQAILDAINPISVESAILGLGTNQSYVGGILAQVWGIHLDHPLSSPFPKAEDLPDDRIFDADGDGNLGITLIMGAEFCRLYAIQRSLSSVRGMRIRPWEIVGTGSMNTEQTILGASEPICGLAFETASNDAYNYARMVRIDEHGLNLNRDDNDKITCQTVLEAEDQLITWQEPDRSRCQ